ncbi:hypothetical protein JCM15519_16680 [Fundidesulfovibrio butyratiphilus]
MTTRFFNTLPSRLEGLCLLALSGFLFWLVFGGDYWMYLNPKFRPLSATTAAVLAGFGVLCLARPETGTRWIRMAAYLVALALVAASQASLTRTAFDSGSLGTDPQGTDRLATEPDLPSRAELDGRQYLRLNLGELYDLATQHRSENLDHGFVVRGFVYRNPDLDKSGEFILYRVAMYCCFADATSVGFRLRPPKGHPLPPKGQWLVAYARLAEAPKHDDDSLKVGDSPFTSVQPDTVLLADKLEPAEPPKTGLGMMYEWHTQEPYAF